MGRSISDDWKDYHEVRFGMNKTERILDLYNRLIDRERVDYQDSLVRNCKIEAKRYGVSQKSIQNDITIIRQFLENKTHRTIQRLEKQYGEDAGDIDIEVDEIKFIEKSYYMRYTYHITIDSYKLLKQQERDHKLKNLFRRLSAKNANE